MKRSIICGTIAVLLIVLAGAPSYAQYGYPLPDHADPLASMYTTYEEAFMPLDTGYPEPPGELILFDVLVLRPLGLAASAIGFAGSILALPFAATSNSGDIVGRKLIQDPFCYTFARPLGYVDYSPVGEIGY